MSVEGRSSLSESLARSKAWSGNSAELVEAARKIWRDNSSSQVSPETAFPKWIATDYRAAGIISPAVRKRFAWHHLVQLVAARALALEGWTRSKLEEWAEGRALEGYLAVIDRPAGGVEQAGIDSPGDAFDLERLRVAVRLLAAGLVAQFKTAREGGVVAHSDDMPAPLARALHQFAALHILEGVPDETGSVHELICACLSPIGEPPWRLASLRHPAFAFRGIRLLDPDARLPTLDCLDLARGGDTEDNVREQIAFEELRATAEQFADAAANAYALLRRYVVENPVTSKDHMTAFARKEQLQSALQFLASCYEHVQPHHCVGGHLDVCPECNAPRRSVAGTSYSRCVLPQCARFGQSSEPSKSRAKRSDLFIARQHILAYWIGPGLDELRLAKEADRLLSTATLYPHFDACDLELDSGSTGVDVKSHANPFVLAESLNRSLGGLGAYARRIIAVNDQSIRRFPGYLEILRAELRNVDVEVVAVSDLLDRMQRAA